MASLWLGTDLASQRVIALKFDHMSLQSWGLSSRTLNASLSYNFKMTVGDVIRAGESVTTIRGLGEAGIAELNAKLSQLLTKPLNGTEAQLSKDQNAVLPDSKASIDPHPKLLPQSVQNFPLDQLHLDMKTHSALVKSGIATIGALYNASNSHLGDIQAFHSGSLGNVWSEPM